MLLVEVEGLGELRSRHGAFVADETMKAVARRLKRTVRDHDVVGRYGDARFVLVAVADKDGARALCGRIQRAVQHEPVTVAELKLPVEVRIGGATNRSEGVEIMEDLFTVAEAALARTNPDTAAIHITE